jgi:16S rRNA (guanine966-N2)-methyltransferase
MRVIAGKYRGRRLRSLTGHDLRPTGDKLRETLFDVLTGGNPNALEGTVWIDLFAGTGAVGIEALSHGADMVYWVERSARAAELIRANFEMLKTAANVRVLRKEAVRALRELESGGVHADFVFLDPPYRLEDAYRQVLDLLSNSEVLRSESIVIAEHHKKFDPGDAFGVLRRYRKLALGESALCFYRSFLRN